MEDSNIIISQAPNEIASAYRPIIFRVETMTGSVPAMKAEIFTRTGTNVFSLQAVKKMRPYKANNYFIFDVAPVVQSLLSFDRQSVFQASGNITPCLNSIVEYKVKFTELTYDIYGNDIAGTVLWSSVYRAVNAIPQHEEDQTLSAYIIPAGAPT